MTDPDQAIMCASERAPRRRFHCGADSAIQSRQHSLPSAAHFSLVGFRRETVRVVTVSHVAGVDATN